MKSLQLKKHFFAGLLIGLLGLLIAPQVQAQKYSLAVGWRAGGMTNGITAKIVPVKGFAVEGILNLYPYGPSIGAMLERHKPILCIQALQVYYGVGGHYRWAYHNNVYADPFQGIVEGTPPPGNRGVGIDAVAGIELKIPLLPIAVSAEIKPMVEWTDQRAILMGWDPGFGLKVVF